MTLFLATIQTLGGLAVIAVVVGVALIVAVARPAGRTRIREALEGQDRHPIGWAWGVALTAMAGSLYFSEVVGFAPCVLCWYQRIAMYPLVFVLGAGLWLRDPGVWRFAIPLPIIGFLIAAYHVALQYQPALELIPCESGVPCTGRYMAAFGFVSIPVMAGAAFLLITALLLVVRVLEGDVEAL